MYRTETFLVLFTGRSLVVADTKAREFFVTARMQKYNTKKNRGRLIFNSFTKRFKTDLLAYLAAYILQAKVAGKI